MKMQKLDRLGRVVIPVSYRKALEFDENAMLSVSMESGALMIRRVKLLCRLCGLPISDDKEIPLCDNCVEKVKNLPR